MSLVPKQWDFSRLLARLILHAEYLGYAVTLGEAWRHPSRPGGHPRSTHRSRLAVDLNLFEWREGAWHWLVRTEDHEGLGAYWESLDPRCRWGGRFDDGNHYSFEHEGVQ